MSKFCLRAHEMDVQGLTDCANTRWRNTCITYGGFGNTAWMMRYSCSTVYRISSKRFVSPGSSLGTGAPGSGSEVQLRDLNLVHGRKRRTTSSHIAIFDLAEICHLSFRYEKVVLVHVYLNARRAAIEIEEGLCAMLKCIELAGSFLQQGLYTRPSCLGHLCDMICRTGEACPFRTARNTSRSALESKPVISPHNCP